MRKNYGLAALLGTLFVGMLFTAQASEEQKNELLLAQVYGSICQTASYQCQMDYEDELGSPCECNGEYGTVVGY